MQYITWLRELICPFFWILAFSIISYSSFFNFLISLLPSASISLPPLLSPFCYSFLPTGPIVTLMAPLHSLPLFYLQKSLPTGHVTRDALQCPGKGYIEQRGWNLRSGRTGICKKSCRKEKPGVPWYRKRKELSSSTGRKNSLKHICLELSVQEKIYFIVGRRKINRKVFHLWSVGCLILSGVSVCVHVRIRHCCYFITECHYETSLTSFHQSSFSDMWSLV